MNDLEPKKLPYHAFCKFREKYARASKKFSELVEFDHGFDFKSCRENRKTWELYKFGVKFSELWEKTEDAFELGPKMALGDAIMDAWAYNSETRESCPPMHRIQELVVRYFW